MNSHRAEAMGPPPPVPGKGYGKAVVKTSDFKLAMARNAAPSSVSEPAAAQPVAAPAVMTMERDAAGGLLIQASLGGAARAAMPRGGGLGASDPLRARLAVAERSTGHPDQGYGLRNAASGALGRYQLTPIALRDIGWQDANGQWTAKATALGVTDEAGFLASPVAQEAAMGDYLARTEQILAAQGSLALRGQRVTGTDGEGVAVTRAGLLAAAHRRGAGAVAAWLDHQVNRPEAPLSAAQRNVFASIEGRMRDFADLEAPGRAVA